MALPLARNAPGRSSIPVATKHAKVNWIFYPTSNQQINAKLEPESKHPDEEQGASIINALWLEGVTLVHTFHKRASAQQL